MAEALEATKAAMAVASEDAKATKTAFRAEDLDIKAVRFSYGGVGISLSVLTRYSGDCTQGQKCYSCGQTGHISVSISVLLTLH
jgi:Zinc knuckle